MTLCGFYGFTCNTLDCLAHLAKTVAMEDACLLTSNRLMNNESHELYVACFCIEHKNHHLL